MAFYTIDELRAAARKRGLTVTVGEHCITVDGPGVRVMAVSLSRIDPRDLEPVDRRPWPPRQRREPVA